MLIWASAIMLASNPQALDANFENDLVFVSIRTARNDALQVFTDTGGGMFLFQDSAERADRLTPGEGGIPVAQVAPAHITAVLRAEDRVGVTPREMPPGCENAEGASLGESDGMFGGRWFAGRAWQFDYEAGTLHIIETGNVPETGGWSSFDMHFLEDPEVPEHERPHFPRVTVEIAGEAVELLFDTGAQGCHLLPGEEGPPLWRATSFISASLARRWRAAHPEWRYLEGGDGLFQPTDMIEAGSVRLAGTELGPVWFVIRPDRNFSEFMSQWMDEPVAGALGGNALSGREVVLDYPAWRGALR